ARVRGGREGVVAALAEDLHKFCSDEAGAPDNDDLHGVSPFLRRQGLPSMERKVARAQAGSPCLRLGLSLGKSCLFVQMEKRPMAGHRKRCGTRHAAVPSGLILIESRLG